MEIISGTTGYARDIYDIAEQAWADTYGHILSQEQIDYMLDMMYSPQAIDDQINKRGHHFYLIREDASACWQGFVSYEYDYQGAHKTKLHKLYVLPSCHGLGFGRILIEKVCEDARKHGNKSVLLNMNRNNATLGFYKHMGFEIIGEEDIDIGNGFLMEDYIFEKQL
ncbi:GNAT family N-acetyltransferase [Dysgonomonas sp. 25]|uniref:GNAT family N-acetyltransferase n=1 Tax=Dysgonomonas sp. 25 TaxID=2302933 RepID=UPI0013D4B3AD|nr:GNAT family N-acetyltransferase [Dysgonomonas sp. 25]NDV69585.1 GNAT family N-acetyltransferase [Dysgonomonas sp. 25]